MAEASFRQKPMAKFDGGKLAQKEFGRVGATARSVTPVLNSRFGVTERSLTPGPSWPKVLGWGVRLSGCADWTNLEQALHLDPAPGAGGKSTAAPWARFTAMCLGHPVKHGINA